MPRGVPSPTANGRQVISSLISRLRVWHVLALAFAVRFAVGLSTDSVLHPDEVMEYFEQAHRLVFGPGLIHWGVRLRHSLLGAGALHCRHPRRGSPRWVRRAASVSACGQGSAQCRQPRDSVPGIPDRPCALHRAGRPHGTDLHRLLVQARHLRSPLDHRCAGGVPGLRCAGARVCPAAPSCDRELRHSSASPAYCATSSHLRLV